MPDAAPHHTAFLGHRLLASGALQEVALAVQRCLADDPNAMPLVFDDATGKQVDLDLRGTAAEVAARHAPPPAAPVSEPEPAPPRGRGRPRLGVVAREVTLLPEHWDWLAAQPGGASVALRKLVHQARRAAAASEGTTQARDRAYAFMSAVGGDLPGFEEATRALFAGDLPKLEGLIARWPPDVCAHVLRLAASEPAAPL